MSFMGRSLFLRVEAGALLTLAVLLQLGFLVEFHSPDPSDPVLAFLTVSSIFCFLAFWLIRGRLVRRRKLAYH